VKVLICGSRDWSDESVIGARIDHLKRDVTVPWDVLIIVGDASGADAIAYRLAFNAGMRVKTFWADWEKYGARAGPLRNRQMLDANPDRVIAFWDGISRGTKDTITEAEKRGIFVEIVYGGGE
jgi:YspA, cpYpsA-related SLOG family